MKVSNIKKKGLDTGWCPDKAADTVDKLIHSTRLELIFHSAVLHCCSWRFFFFKSVCSSELHRFLVSETLKVS